MLQSPPKTENYGFLKGGTEPLYMELVLTCAMKSSGPLPPSTPLSASLWGARLYAERQTPLPHQWRLTVNWQNPVVYKNPVIQHKGAGEKISSLRKTVHLCSHFPSFTAVHVAIISVLCGVYKVKKKKKKVLPFLSPDHLLKCCSHHHDVLHSQTVPLKALRLVIPLVPENHWINLYKVWLRISFREIRQGQMIWLFTLWS